MIEEKIELLYSQLIESINYVKNVYYNRLLTEFFINDTEFIIKFKKIPAGAGTHHAYCGGLLEHTLGVMQICDYFGKIYPMMNRDLLITSSMLHDIGKIKELSENHPQSYSDDGEFIGHIVLGYEMICNKILKIENFPLELKKELQHCILAHHGELEYGSPKKPAIMEALALSYSDIVDAKLHLMYEILEKNHNEKDEWLGYNPFFESNVKESCYYNSSKGPLILSKEGMTRNT